LIHFYKRVNNPGRKKWSLALIGANRVITWSNNGNWYDCG